MKKNITKLLILSSLLVGPFTQPIISYAEVATSQTEEKYTANLKSSEILESGESSSAMFDELSQEGGVTSASETLTFSTESSSDLTSSENQSDTANSLTSQKADFEKPKVSYQTHVKNVGWQKEVSDGQEAGTTGRNLWVEGLKLAVENTALIGSVQYKAHVRNVGWQNWMENGQLAGTVGKVLPTEAYQVRLTGELAKQYDIYYRVHSSYLGWLDWAKNGQVAGSEGFAYHVEAIQIQLVDKGSSAPGAMVRPFMKRTASTYQTHVKNVGWQTTVGDGQIGGTTGRNLWIEGLRLNFKEPVLSGNIQYKAHVRNSGWQNWATNGQLAGIVGKALPTEAYQIQLTGELTQFYDVYYRVHSQNFGWLGWAKNGQSAGTQGFGYHSEALQIKVVPKGWASPGNLGNAFKINTRPKEIIIKNVPYVSQYTPVFAPWGCAAAAMTMLLRSKGTQVDLRKAQDNLPMYPASPGGQKGNVYTGVGFGWVITPGTLTEYMKTWYPNVYNISGTNIKGIINHVLEGNPVLYYGYSSYQKTGDFVRNHAKVIVGYKDNNFLVYDPLYYNSTDGAGTGGKNMLYDRGAQHWLPVSNFQSEYNNQAIVIK